jgi:hypothetical protein
MREVTDAMGLNQDHLAVIARIRSNRISRAMPARARSTVKRVIAAPVDARLDKIAQAVTPKFLAIRHRAQRAAEAQREHFHTMGMDLGYVYRSAAICDDGSTAPQGPNPVIDYAPCLNPGARFPHFQLCQGAPTLTSSHALLGGDHFLLAGLGCHGDSAAGLAQAATQRTGVPVRGADLNVLASPAARQMLATWTPDDTDCLVLVRPDGHIAWRHVGSGPVNAGDLVSVLGQVLQLPAGTALGHAQAA